MRLVTIAVFAALWAFSAWAEPEAVSPSPGHTLKLERAELPSPSFSAALDRKVQSAFDNTTLGETRAVLVVHKGQLLQENYTDGFDDTTLMTSWSMAKSITHALVGRAVALGLIENIDAPMPSPWNASDKRASITWRQWMQMTDGLNYKEMEASLTQSDVAKMMFGEGRWDVVGYMKGLKLAHEPGAHWNYSSGATHLVARALQSVVLNTPIDVKCSTQTSEKMKAAVSPTTVCSPIDAPFAAWADRELFDPLGIRAQMEFDPAGTWLGGSLVWMTAQDFTKFGFLYLNDGVWDGQRLLPEGWVEFASSPGPAANSDVYGAGFWLTPSEGRGKPVHGASARGPRDIFSAQGLGGQMIAISPEHDLLIVRLGAGTDTTAEWDALYDWIADVADVFVSLKAEGLTNPVASE